MTKLEILSLTKNILRQIDKTSVFHEVVVERVLEQAINSVYFSMHAKTPMFLGKYTKRYTIQGIDEDIDNNRYYVDMPVDIVPLPDKRGGVRSITSTVTPTATFMPVTDQEMLLMEETDADNITTTTPPIIWFIVRNDIIEFKNMSTVVSLGDVNLDLVVAFHDLLDSDPVTLPYGQDYQVIEMAIKMLGYIPPKDLLDNNASIAQ